MVQQLKAAYDKAVAEQQHCLASALQRDLKTISNAKEEYSWIESMMDFRRQKPDAPKNIVKPSGNLNTPSSAGLADVMGNATRAALPRLAGSKRSRAHLPHLRHWYRPNLHLSSDGLLLLNT